MLSLSILIPAFNEEAAIAETIETIRQQAGFFKDLEIIVINDGSTDRTGEIARGLHVTLIEHPVNRGYGAAVKTGLLQARFDTILVAGADGSYPLEDIPKLMAAASTHDMVVGARTGEVVQAPPLRRAGKFIVTFLAEHLSGQAIPDLNSNLRLFRKDVATRFLPLYPDGSSFPVIITLAMLTHHYRVKFIPVLYQRHAGKSSSHPLRDFVDFTILVLRICGYFKPLEVFVPPGLLLIGLGLLKGIGDYAGGHDIDLLAAVLILIGVQMLFVGLLADLIDQRIKL